MATSTSSEDGIWPGFVDALTNVVFVMIIVVMVLMLMFMATLLKVVKSERERVAAQITATEVQKINQQLVDAAALSASASSRVEQLRAPSPAVATPVVKVIPANKIKLGDQELLPELGLLFVAFEGPDSDLDEKAKRDIQRVLAPHMESLRVSGVALRADAVPPFVSEGRRLAYYRVVRLREWLVEQGVRVSLVDMRISDRPSVEGKQGVLFMRRTPAAATGQQAQQN